jgi:hypothetical protein
MFQTICRIMCVLRVLWRLRQQNHNEMLPGNLGMMRHMDAVAGLAARLPAEQLGTSICLSACHCRLLSWTCWQSAWSETGRFDHMNASQFWVHVTRSTCMIRSRHASLWHLLVANLQYYFVLHSTSVHTSDVKPLQRYSEPVAPRTNIGRM